MNRQLGSLAKKMCFFTLGATMLVSYWKMNKVVHCLQNENKIENKQTTREYFEVVDLEKLQKSYPNLIVIKTKAVDMLIGKIRDKNVQTEQFRSLSRRIIRLIVEEALSLECDETIVKESPLGLYKTIHNPRPNTDYIAISILRSGNSMVDELVQLMPDVSIGKILVQRNEETDDKKPIFFFEKLPKDVASKRIFLLDPMLATGGSAGAAIEILLKKGVKEENIIFLNLISCITGIEILFAKYPKIKVVTAKIDKDLVKASKYIAPGVGDFGDRFYGTMH